MANKNRVYINRERLSTQNRRAKSADNREKENLEGLPEDFIPLYQSRLELLGKVEQIQKRLRVGFSQPLQDYYHDLLKKDAQLLAKMLEYWMA